MVELASVGFFLCSSMICSRVRIAFEFDWTEVEVEEKVDADGREDEDEEDVTDANEFVEDELVGGD